MSEAKGWAGAVTGAARGLSPAAALTQLHSLMSTLTHGLGMDETLAAVTDCVVAGLDFGVAVLAVVEESGMRIVAASGDEDARAALLGECVPEEAMRRLLDSSERVGPTGMLYFSGHDSRRDWDDAIPFWVSTTVAEAQDDDDDRPMWDALDALIAPLRSASGEVVGLLSVDVPGDGRRPGAAQLGLLEMFAVQAAIAIEHARLHTAVMRAQEENRSALAARLQALIDASPTALVEIDLGGVIREWNHAAEVLLGHRADETVGKHLLELSAGRFTMAALHKVLALGAPSSRELQLRRRDGELVEVELSTALTRGPGGEVAGIMGLLVDITERKALSAELRHRALYDALTGLGNRAFLTDALDAALALSAVGGERVAVLVIDLDRFKEVNDALGHDHGDLLLCAVAGRLREVSRPGDIVARLSADEFAVVIADVPDSAAVSRAAERIMATLHRSYDLEGVMVDVEASIGIALAPEHGVEGVLLLRHATSAMSAAKARAEGAVTYVPHAASGAPNRLALLGDLRRALDRGELVLHYQPKIDLASGTLAGVEALVRWDHPHRGLLAPAAFLEVAESTGLITTLTLQVLDIAVAQTRSWAREGHHIPVSVNLSARCLHQASLPEQVHQTLIRHDVPAELLCLELTESAIMADPHRALRILNSLADQGVALSLDDFGTGYSSMAYLRRLPVNELKIDRSFIAEMATNPQDSILVRSVIELGHNMNLHVVAEGIEDQATQDALSSLGCDQAQGYHLGRPMPPATFATWHFAHRALLQP